MIQVVAAALVFQDQVLVAKRQMRPHLDENRWEFPGGKIEAEESEEVALKREIFEELAIVIEGPISLIATSMTPKFQIRLYVTQIQDQRWSKKDHEDVRYVHWKDLVEIPFLPSNQNFIVPLQDWFRKQGFR